MKQFFILGILLIMIYGIKNILTDDFIPNSLSCKVLEDSLHANRWRCEYKATIRNRLCKFECSKGDIALVNCTTTYNRAALYPLCSDLYCVHNTQLDPSYPGFEDLLRPFINITITNTHDVDEMAFDGAM